MGRHVHLWRIGHFGRPLLVFPSASGMAHEWEAHGMLGALQDLIDGGRIKLYCTESNVAEAWTRREADPRWRMDRHLAYERYVVDELAPMIRADCRSETLPIGVAGTSLGGYYACNFALKHPEIFPWALCLSARYDVNEFTDPGIVPDAYFNNPMAYVPNLDGRELERLRRRVHLVLVCGQGRWEDGNVDEARAFGYLLHTKGISHELDIWGSDVSHEWPWWRRQARYHIGRALA